ncbi:diguanylate phosphodiesterase (plasmid) [Pseudoalteromonas sp. Bsw20308]|uniref:EAL domain-containing protein n=1 Tax=Pseudoalteromonas sp. Bsw20308 TaxID=283699 RepID=UPI0002AAC329|nr:EAL domain-containing protein [Pseudoalteromonas sp. Bsw20308]ALQ09930.1 diguanylate phosphodiesterase [Pseudoalteromonas sp. Bsw20308]
MKKGHKKSIIALLTGILVFVTGSLILLYFAGQKLAATISEDATHLVKHIDTALQERRRILTPLNNLGFKQCDQATLLEMRRALFDAKYVIDIGFFKNDQLVCTTGAGLLDKVINDKSPDYIIVDENIRVRFEPQLYLLLFSDRPMEVIIVRQGDYNLIIDTKVFNDDVISSLMWEVVYKHKRSINHLAGQSGVYDTLVNNVYLPYERQLICSEQNSNYCVALHMPWNKFFAKNHFLLIISLILTCLAGVSSALLVDNLIADRRSTFNRIRLGLNKNSFYWTYQPIICLQTGTVIGCEVLARFKDKYGTLYPDQFIPLLRKNNLTWKFTEAMIAKVLKELTAIDILPEGFKVSLNIFPCDVEQGNVSSLTQVSELTNSRFIICLEITEDEYLDTSIAHAHFRALVKSGFNLSLDDFGTGYSNLKNLQNLSFHQLKIDRTFVQDIATEGLKASMIPNIMELVTKFNYTCVAEGIETSEQEAILKTAGVHYGQGWKYGRPMKVNKFHEYMAKQSV